MTDQPITDNAPEPGASEPAPPPPASCVAPAGDTPRTYEFTRPELPQGLAYDEALETSFAETAATLDLSPEQAQGLVDAFGAYQARAFTTALGAAADDGRALEAELQAEWGGDYARNIETARRAVTALAGDDATLAQLTDALGEAGVVRFFHRIGGLMAEDTLTGAGEGEFGLGPRGALAEVARIESELAALLARQDGAAMADRQRLEARRRALLARAYPEG